MAVPDEGEGGLGADVAGAGSDGVEDPGLVQEMCGRSRYLHTFYLVAVQAADVDHQRGGDPDDLFHLLRTEGHKG